MYDKCGQCNLDTAICNEGVDGNKALIYKPALSNTEEDTGCMSCY